MACVSDYFSLQETRSGDISAVVVHFCLLANELIIYRMEEARSRPIQELMNIVLASVHVQGEGDVSWNSSSCSEH